MKKITPFLWFDNNAEEAVRFYTSVFKDSKVHTTADNTDATPAPQGTTMVVYFQLFGQDFIALNGGPQFKFNESVSFVVNCETQEEIDYYWEQLSDGGAESRCGWLKDRFGLSWQVVPANISRLLSGGGEKTKRVMDAVMKMDKLDMAQLQAAYEGQ